MGPDDVGDLVAKARPYLDGAPKMGQFEAGFLDAYGRLPNRRERRAEARRMARQGK